MSLFEQLKISSDCYLCGCAVNSSDWASSNLYTHSTSKPTYQQQAPIICHYCHQRLPISKTACITCGLPLAAVANSNSNVNTPCGECLKQSPPYDQTVSGFHYEAPISEFITHVKYSAQFQLLSLLCDYLIEKIQLRYKDIKRPTAIIAVPLHPNKLIKRGFNQSQLIADRLAKTLSINTWSKGIHRIKETKAQSGLDAVERKSNVKGAFQIDTQLPNHIAIVDDVVTTGMTVSEIAKQAKLHGAKKIDIWCLARAYDL